MRALAVTRAGQLASRAEWGCDALFYSLFGNQVCEGPGTMQRLPGLPVTSRTLIQGGRRQRAGAGRGGASLPVLLRPLLAHVPHCSLLASQGHVEGAGCFPAAEERVLTRLPDVHQIGMEVVIVIHVKMLL